ncbi:tRNA (guanosine(37)-N1)-methyltransferase TrmD ['Osedax' symbiont bacterium Rs2_46_30_T18]|nr:tRNA (guanosine(37)-N1)-methyltransferase TrmD ['Osedax' symbiont bacterium Rs2_46_30_T18]
MWFGVVSLFPEMFESITRFGVTGRAIKRELVQVECWNPRDFTADKHRTVDDRPFGGGPGMLMKVQPLKDAIQAARSAAPGEVKVVYLSPQGRQLNHQLVKELGSMQNLILVAGRYEGIDERLIESDIDMELSLGDFVLSGGELPAMTVIDAVSRLVPGVLGHVDSASEDSFAEGLLDCPHYTRPEVFEDQQVPEVLLSGDHAKIKRWRLKQQLGRTYQRRPELLQALDLNPEQQQLLEEYICETEKSGS